LIKNHGLSRMETGSEKEYQRNIKKLILFMI
jgi:hypothetical protein